LFLEIKSKKNLYGIHGDEAALVAGEFYNSMKLLKSWGTTTASTPKRQKTGIPMILQVLKFF
jgi:hypothetical protein